MKDMNLYLYWMDDWLRKKIHPDYLDFNKVEYDFHDFYWNAQGGVAIGYHVPEQPIKFRKEVDQAGLKLKRSIDL